MNRNMNSNTQNSSEIQKELTDIYNITYKLQDSYLVWQNWLYLQRKTGNYSDFFFLDKKPVSLNIIGDEVLIGESMKIITLIENDFKFHNASVSFTKQIQDFIQILVSSVTKFSKPVTNLSHCVTVETFRIFNEKTITYRCKGFLLVFDIGDLASENQITERNVVLFNFDEGKSWIKEEFLNLVSFLLISQLNKAIFCSDMNSNSSKQKYNQHETELLQLLRNENKKLEIEKLKQWFWGFSHEQQKLLLNLTYPSDKRAVLEQTIKVVSRQVLGLLEERYEVPFNCMSNKLRDKEKLKKNLEFRNTKFKKPVSSDDLKQLFKFTFSCINQNPLDLGDNIGSNVSLKTKICSSFQTDRKNIHMQKISNTANDEGEEKIEKQKIGRGHFPDDNNRNKKIKIVESSENINLIRLEQPLQQIIASKQPVSDETIFIEEKKIKQFIDNDKLVFTLTDYYKSSLDSYFVDYSDNKKTTKPQKLSDQCLPGAHAIYLNNIDFDHLNLVVKFKFNLTYDGTTLLNKDKIFKTERKMVDPNKRYTFENLIELIVISDRYLELWVILGQIVNQTRLWSNICKYLLFLPYKEYNLGDYDGWKDKDYYEKYVMDHKKFDFTVKKHLSAVHWVMQLEAWDFKHSFNNALLKLKPNTDTKIFVPPDWIWEFLNSQLMMVNNKLLTTNTCFLPKLNWTCSLPYSLPKEVLYIDKINANSLQPNKEFFFVSSLNLTFEDKTKTFSADEYQYFQEINKELPSWIKRYLEQILFEILHVKAEQDTPSILSTIQFIDLMILPLDLILFRIEFRVDQYANEDFISMMEYSFFVLFRKRIEMLIRGKILSKIAAQNNNGNNNNSSVNNLPIEHSFGNNYQANYYNWNIAMANTYLHQQEQPQQQQQIHNRLASFPEDNEFINEQCGMINSQEHNHLLQQLHPPQLLNEYSQTLVPSLFNFSYPNFKFNLTFTDLFVRNNIDNEVVMMVKEEEEEEEIMKEREDIGQRKTNRQQQQLLPQNTSMSNDRKEIAMKFNKQMSISRLPIFLHPDTLITMYPKTLITDTNKEREMCELLAKNSFSLILQFLSSIKAKASHFGITMQICLEKKLFEKVEKVEKNEDDSEEQHEDFPRKKLYKVNRKAISDLINNNNQYDFKKYHSILQSYILHPQRVDSYLRRVMFLVQEKVPDLEKLPEKSDVPNIYILVIAEFIAIFHYSLSLAR